MAFVYASVLLAAAAAFILAVRLCTARHEPKEPPLLHATIPVIGHLLGLIRYNIDYFTKIIHDSPYPAATLPVLNGKLYVITTADLLPVAFRSKTLDFSPFIIDFAHHGLRFSPAAMKMLSEPQPDIKGTSLLKDTHSSMQETMRPGQGLMDMNDRVLAVLVGYTNTVGTSWESRELYQWFRDIFTISSSKALYGTNDVISRSPSLIDDLWKWDEDHSLLLTVPFLAKEADLARQRCQAAFLEYYENGWDDEAGALVQGRNRVARKWGLPLEDMARAELSVLFVTVTNAMPSAFWLLCYILADPLLRADIEAELQDLVKFHGGEDGMTQGNIDISKFNGGTPLLISAYHETLRLTNQQVGFRKVLKDTVLTSPSTGQDYLFRAGNTLQIPSALMHTSVSVWGESAATFDARRFLRKDDPNLTSKSEKKAQSQAFLPFGGGKHLCPGRFFAQAEILGLIAVLLLGYDIVGRDGTFEIPGARKQKFGIAVKRPANDVGIRIRKREDRSNVKWSFMTGTGKGVPMDFTEIS